jgi:hypothetical protein
MLEEDENEDQSGQNETEKKDIKEQYEEATNVDDDEKDFISFILRMSKIERQMVILSEEFHDGEVNPYEAKTKLLALLDISNQVREELMKTL